MGNQEIDYELGALYSSFDSEKSIYYYQKSASQGNKAAQIILGRV